MWNKIFDIPAFFAAGCLFVYGLLGIIKSEKLEEGDMAPSYFIIMSLFIVMFIIGAKRQRKFQDKMNDKDEPPGNH